MSKTAIKIAKPQAHDKAAAAAGEIKTTENTTAAPAQDKTAPAAVTAPGGIVAVRDYVTGKGYSGMVDWDGDNVTVGGYVIKPEFVKDGTAYVAKSAADAAVSRVEKNAGIKKSEDIEKAVEKKYGERIEAALSELAEGFSYDPDSDPVFAAYRDMYVREGDEAYRRVLNDNNTSAAAASGAVLSEAMAARNESMKKIADAVPALAADAYKRYTDRGNMLSSEIKTLSSLADGYYDRLYNAGRDRYNDLIKAGAAEREEKQRQSDLEQRTRDNEMKGRQFELELEKFAEQQEQNRINNERSLASDAYKNALSAQALARGDIELEYYPQIIESGIVSTNLQNSNIALNNALMRGFFTAEDEAALPWLADYRTSSGYSVNPLLTQAALEYQKEYNKKRAEINAVMGW